MSEKTVNDPNLIALDESSLKEIHDALIERDKIREAAVLRQGGMDRRTFLKLMGSSLALTGVAAMTGCVATSPPEGQIIPYVEVPEEIIPGKPLFFATSAVLGGMATGVLLETHQGRPTRIEGNPKHPASLGASDIKTQASILELYNPDRSIYVRNDGAIRSWDEFMAAVETANVFADGGAGMRILTETVTSPALAAQINDLLEQNPGAKWYQYEPVAADNLVAGAEMAFGEAVNTVLNFEAAQIVLAIDGDFLENLAYARGFMAQRKVREGATTMNRLYAVESTPGNIGTVADHRLALRPSDIENFVRALAVALGVAGVAEPVGTPWDTVWFDAVVSDLEANPGASIVTAGMGMSPAVQALVHAINDALGNAGTTIIYGPPVQANPVVQATQIEELATEMRDGEVSALLILGGNPAYNAPANIGFADALALVPFSAHLSLYVDETSELATWHLPQTHFVEAWGDALAFDGTPSIVQPPIGALYEDVRSAHAVLAMLLGDERSGYDIVREYWQSEYSGGDFEAFWRKSLHDGVVDMTPDPVQPALDSGLGAAIEAAGTPAPFGLEIVFRPDPALFDGRFASNTWLQELPHPISKISWDTAAYLSPVTAEELGVENNDLVDILYENNVLQIPVWVMPGHADNTVTVYLGYGRGNCSELEEDLNFSAYAIRTSAAQWTGSGANIEAASGNYEIVTIRGEMDISEGDVEPIHFGFLNEYLQDPKSVHGKEAKTISLLEPYEYDSYAWGMSIDLTSCIGCNACMIACQVENNIPNVGKEGIKQQREMYWIRVDRYYVEDTDETLRTHHQPVPCMQCENAPCEQVCPVHATVHGAEGLNQMIYNRCVGTRYCAANCPYSVRRFNFFDYVDDAPIMEEWRNPNVSVRPEGVMEKCTYCVQRINAARIEARKENRLIRDGEVIPACGAACPTEAIIMGDLNDANSKVSMVKAEELDYGLLAKLNTQPRTTYLAALSNPNEALRRATSEE